MTPSRFYYRSSTASIWLLVAVAYLPAGGEPAAKSKTAAKSSEAKLASAEALAFFEKKIRPVLVAECYSCHSKTAKKLGGKLLLDSREGLLSGGQSGALLKPGQPDASLLIQAIKYDGLEMPPEKPLPPAVVADFVKWVAMGAPYPATKAAPAKTATARPEALWSLQPLGKPIIPTVADPSWSRSAIDRFVFARLEAAQLQPVADADPRSLLRRLHYDLIGLPPTFERCQSFAAEYDRDPAGAMEKAVDELLASPRFGERWGRHWLDVARFGESNGNDGLSRNPTLPHAWRYRDYVIQAFNEDLPYDRFLTEQLAGDLLPAATPAERDRLLIATGYLALAAKPAKAMNINFEMDIVADQIEAVGSGIMGLSVGCARCHDHKHDPIPTRDYYALAGIFKSTETLYGLAANEPLSAPATPLHPLKSWKAAPKSSLVAPPPTKNTAKPKITYPSDAGLAMGARDRAGPQDCKINIQGEANKLGASVPRGYLQACGSPDPPAIPENQSGRLQLAKWLTDPRHPLTARVMANRTWHFLFSRGLVSSCDDFGVYGEAPSHPELLDHLAQEFMANQWSVKSLIRRIVLSRTYRLGAGDYDDGLRIDPDNRLLWRHERRRLDAESLRDSVLAVSGRLDPTPPYGSPIAHLDILVNRAGNLHLPSNHRSVYLCRLRNSDPPELAAFDLPDPTKPAGSRTVTTLPSQSLFLLNSDFLVEQSNFFASSLLNGSPGGVDDAARVRAAYQRALLRDASPAESAQAAEYLKAMDADLVRAEPDPARRRLRVWASLAQALLAANEFRYID